MSINEIKNRGLHAPVSEEKLNTFLAIKGMIELLNRSHSRVGVAMLMLLINEFNRESYQPIETDVKNFIDKGIDSVGELTFYSDDSRLYIGPKLMRNNTNIYGLSRNMEYQSMFALGTTDENEWFNYHASRINPVKRITKLGFVKTYSAQLGNGNTEYIFYHPKYRATLHFELTPKGYLFSSNKEDIARIYAKVPYNTGTPGEVSVTDIEFDDKISEELEKIYPAEWPKIGKECDLFVSTEDRQISIYEGLNYEEARRFFFTRALQKIAQSPFLNSTFWVNNSDLITDVEQNIGLTSENALENARPRFM